MTTSRGISDADATAASLLIRAHELRLASDYYQGHMLSALSRTCRAIAIEYEHLATHYR